MEMEQNPLTNDWLCFIPECPSHGYYYPTKKSAKKFVDKVNAAIERGELYLENGKLKKKEIIYEKRNSMR